MGGYSNPFDAPLNSEIQEHQAAQQATQAASPNGNPFDEPLASEKAEAQLKATPGADIQPVTTSTNPKLVVAAAGEHIPEYVGAVGALAAGTMLGSQTVAPLITALAPHLPNLDKAYKIALALGGGTATVDHLLHILGVLGSSKGK